MHMSRVYIDSVRVPERLRKKDPAKVVALAESIAEIGLQQPISVWSPDDETCDLVVGLHRLLAAQSLGWDEIDCVFLDLDDLDRQLWEIDENLCRADLTDAERAEHTAKRAEVIAAREELKAKLAQNSELKKPEGRPTKGQGAFLKQTAKATGKSTRSIKRDKSRGDKIASDVMKDLKGTDIEDSGVQLDALAKVDHDKQRDAVEQVVLGQAEDVRDVLEPYRHEKSTFWPDHDPAEVRLYALQNAWLKADDQIRNRFAAWLEAKHSVKLIQLPPSRKVGP